VLREGKSVVCTADREIFGPITGEILRVAGKARARVVFTWAERERSGAIKVFFREAPRPYCESQEAIEENLEFLRAATREVFDRLGVPEGERVPLGVA
jgi:predicted esterase